MRCHFPIALHPARCFSSTNQGTNDSEQVLARLTNRGVARVLRGEFHYGFGEAAPFTLRSGLLPEMRAGLLLAPAPLSELLKLNC